MDDLKLYARPSQYFESLFETVRLFTSDIGMTFGMEKCAHLSIKCGKAAKCDGLKLSAGEMVQTLPLSERYRYLGVLRRERDSAQRG